MGSGAKRFRLNGTLARINNPVDNRINLWLRTLVLGETRKILHLLCVEDPKKRDLRLVQLDGLKSLMSVFILHFFLLLKNPFLTQDPMLAFFM